MLTETSTDSKTQLLSPPSFVCSQLFHRLWSQCTHSLITLVHCKLYFRVCFSGTWPTTVGARPDKANIENRIRNCITCHPIGNENLIIADRWIQGSFWHKTVSLLKFSLLVRWNGILVERYALADAMILAFKKHEGKSNYKRSGIKWKLKTGAGT